MDEKQKKKLDELIDEATEQRISSYKMIESAKELLQSQVIRNRKNEKFINTLEELKEIFMFIAYDEELFVDECRGLAEEGINLINESIKYEE